MDKSISTARWGLLLLMMALMNILTLGLKALPATAGPGVSLILNGTQVNPSVPPYIDSNGRTMVPLRFVMEYMGAGVEWVEKEKGIVINRGATTLKMWIGSRQAYVNGQGILLDTTPVLKGGTTMVPVRFVSQAFGGQVEWNTASQTIRITLGTATGTGKVRLTGSYVNIRSGPGLNYTIIDVFPRDTVLGLLGETAGWYRVQLSDGRQGWVSATYAEPVYDNNLPGNGGQPGQDPPPGQTRPPGDNSSPGQGQTPAGQPLGLAVTGSRPVAIMAGPSPVEKQVGTAAAGSKLPIWEERNGWWLVEMDDGRRGWLASALAVYAPYEPPENDDDQESNLRITGVTVKPAGDALQVTVKASWIFTYQISRWDKRLIVDIPGALLAVPEGQRIVEVNHSLVDRVRLGQYTADTVRLVFDLSGIARLRLKEAGAGETTFIIDKPSIQGSKIVLDPGHGTDPEGADPGAIGPTGVKEKDVNLAIAQKLAALLRGAGATVYLTRNGETCPYTLAGRAYYANDVGADLFISIHANASLSSESSGTSTYFYAPPGTALGEQREERQRLAAAIQAALVQAIGRKDLGVLEANFAVLRNTGMPSVLVETAFISNPTEEQLLNNPAFQARVAEGIFNGLGSYFAGN
ncbi:N-acetylmuramoyl-L-alanine amidase [Moorella sulfitireducens]|uniref:N-acetylmuramoyl-L-alanine amidase n=1 Tax=Neomoorella sulfitireducens TaxID=2972948 RepID=UPI0021AC4BB4|nr:N-acetylmuramoyl-L-alanine amidase [Moorella sulfitireducens]